MVINKKNIIKNNLADGGNLNFKSSSKPIINIGVSINKKLINISNLLKKTEAMKNNKYIEMPPKQMVGLE